MPFCTTFRPSLSDRPDMGGLCLGLAAAVDHANARHGASAVIRVTDDAPKGGIANFAIDQYLGDFGAPVLRLAR